MLHLLVDGLQVSQSLSPLSAPLTQHERLGEERSDFKFIYPLRIRAAGITTHCRAAGRRSVRTLLLPGPAAPHLPLLDLDKDVSTCDGVLVWWYAVLTDRSAAPRPCGFPWPQPGTTAADSSLLCREKRKRQRPHVWREGCDSININILHNPVWPFGVKSGKSG